jgi:hypothetical protein
MTGELVKIELTDYEAQAFREFQKHYKDFMALHAGGVFNIRNGSAVLHFDPAGHLTQVDYNLVGFKKGLPIVQTILAI